MAQYSNVGTKLETKVQHVAENMSYIKHFCEPASHTLVFGLHLCLSYLGCEFHTKPGLHLCLGAPGWRIN